MAVITIGDAAVNRDSSLNNELYTGIASTPADGTGVIDTVNIYLSSGGNYEVAIFRKVSPNVFSTVAVASLGTLGSGLQTVTGLSLPVVVGDYIGCKAASGRIERSSTGGTCWYKLNDYIPCTNANFGVPSDGAISLNGTGRTLPAITSLTPNNGTVGSTVTITGISFGASKGTGSVTFNGTAATDITSWSDTEIVCTVPAGATTGNIVVTNDYGYASAGSAFTVDAPATPPAITGLSFSHGAVGDSVTITGTGFGAAQGASTVTFNGTEATVTSWSDTEIVVTVPVGATTGNLTVTTSGGSASEAFTVDTGTPVDPTVWPNYPVLRAYRINVGTIPNVTGAPIIRGKIIGEGDADAHFGAPIVRVVDIGSGALNTHYGTEMARIYLIGEGDADGYAGQETVQLFTVTD